MSIDLKIIEHTADVLDIYFISYIYRRRPGPGRWSVNWRDSMLVDEHNKLKGGNEC